MHAVNEYDNRGKMCRPGFIFWRGNKFFNEKNNKVMKSIIERMNQPTPKFFKTLRNIGLTITAVAAAIAGSPVVLPALIVKAAGYLAVAGTVMVTVSQATVMNEQK